MQVITGIRKAREARGLTQVHLALAAGVSPRTVSRAEAGHPLGGESLRCIHAALSLGEPLRTAPPAIPPFAPAGTDGLPEARSVVAGWLLACPSAEAALHYAADYARRYLDAAYPLHVAALPFRDGYLWEAREGGPCIGHLPSIRKTLEADATGWFPVGKRAFRVSMMDGRPSLVLLTQAMTQSLREEMPVPLVATGPMRTLAA